MNLDNYSKFILVDCFDIIVGNLYFNIQECTDIPKLAKLYDKSFTPKQKREMLFALNQISRILMLGTESTIEMKDRLMPEWREMEKCNYTANEDGKMNIPIYGYHREKKTMNMFRDIEGAEGLNDE